MVKTTLSFTMRYAQALRLLPLVLLWSCVAPPSQEDAQTEVHELPASNLPKHADGPLEYLTTEDLVQAIGTKVRRNLVLPHGKFPASTRVTLRLEVSSEGQVQDLKVTKSSGYPAIDLSVQNAVMKSEPLPVLASLREARRPLAVKMVFLPFSK